MKRLGVALALLTILLPAAPARPAVVQACPGRDGTPGRVVTGSFPKDLQGSYVLVPFDVPAGATRVRVKICYDQPEIPLSFGPYNVRNVLDLGVYDTLGRDGFYDGEEFRGWGGSSRPNVLITPEESTLGFKPGPIRPGRWAAEIGVAAVGGATEGNPDATMNWRLEIFTDRLRSDLDHPWKPARYDARPAKREARWYAGDMHVHAEHSFPFGATLRQTFDYAFKDARLDFITMSEYVTDRHWGEIGRFQRDHPGHLIIRSAEIITYRGHVNNQASLRYVDYRTGPIFERRADGSLRSLRGAQPASRLFRDIHAARDARGRARGWTQVNHPTIFPSQVPTFANLCRGCSWSYSDAETDWSQVDAFEVQTAPSGTSGPPGEELGPNPFTPAAIAMYDQIRRTGFDVTAVGGSDSHRAGRAEPALPPPGDSLPLSTQSPIGEPTTVVYASELSEAGIRDGVLAGHVYVKFFAPDGPDLRFTAAAGDAPEVMMGDELAASQALFTATVLNAKPSVHPRVLLVLRDGVPILAYPVTSDRAAFTFPAVAPGDYRLQLMRGSAFEAMTNPITLVAP